MSGLTLRRAARKIRRLERRWSAVAHRVVVPMRRADRLAGRIRRLYARLGDGRSAEIWRWLGTEPLFATRIRAWYVCVGCMMGSNQDSDDATKCDDCGAVSGHDSWADARAAGWWHGTWYGPEGVATLCPDCCAADAEPGPR